MNKIILLLFSFCVTISNAQSSWKKIDSKNYKAKTELEFRKTTPKAFNLYTLDTENFKKTTSDQNIISIPNNEGEFSKFLINEQSNFTNPIATKYGHIKSYSLKGLDDETATGKISIGIDGVHIIVFSGKYATTYIDPYTKDKSTYISYSKDALDDNDKDFTCLFEESKKNIEQKEVSAAQRNANDGILRTYKLALACTGEYAQFHVDNQGLSFGSDDEKKAAILSAMNTTMARVNGVFEKDLAARMNIVINTNGDNELIFLDSETDNLTNDSASTLINESQSLCDLIIGSANYDIGHTFSTGAGGLAGLGVLCSNGQKGRGVTGTNSPIGDSYDIDYVAHEIGHQFGGSHTFNNSCDDNRNSSTAVEPGSGSTIMAYAGICSPNIVNNSSDYFHAVSIDEMWTVMQNTSCATETITNNIAPIVNAGNDVFVPKSTPLILRGEATDVNDDSLTYTWEQTDNEIATMPPLATNSAGPSFRSTPPSDSPNRYLPSFRTVRNGSTSSEWEVLPSVAREMNFSLLVRDNNANGGATGRDDLNITVTDAEPFTITSPNTAVTWNVGNTKTILWDKSTTDQAPINCENVKISLSTDGGITFPITLVENTPNDGSFDIIVPNLSTTSARIMIEAIDNIFYNINDTNFSIDSTGSTFVLSNTSESQEVCTNINSPVNYTIDVSFINGFSETITLSTDNVPTGITAVLSSTTITDDNQVTLTLSDFENLETGSYTININANSSSINSTLELPTLVVTSNSFDSVVLSSPENNTTIFNLQDIELTWDDVDNANMFDLEVATDSEFNTVIISQENIENNSFIINEILNTSTTYYWRVKPKNDCGDGNFSNAFSFITPKGTYCTSNFTQTTNSEFITNVSLGSIDNNSGDANDESEVGTAGYQDFTNISTDLIAGNTYTLSVTLDPFGFNDHCYVFIDWNNDFIFDETTERYDLGSHYTEISTPTLDILVPEDAFLGETRMRVIIEYFESDLSYGSGACNEDHNWEYGETEDYTLVITSNSLSNNEDVFNDFTLYPNPAEKYVNIAFNIPNIEENIELNLFDLTGQSIKRISSKNNSGIFNEKLDLQNLKSGIYLLKISNGEHSRIEKIIKF